MAFGGHIDTDRLSEETFDLLCRICKRKDKHTEAEKYCVECQDYYCLSCVKVHEDVPGLADHKICGKGQFPSGSVRARSTSRKTASQELTERCDRHSHNCIDMYCQNHDVVGCGTCMAVDHRSCQDIFYIPDYLKDNPSTISSKDIQRKLKTVATKLDEHLQNLKKEKTQLMDMKATTLEHIKTFRKEINERLDELEKCTLDAAEDKYKIMLRKIEDEIKMLENNKSSSTAVQQKLEISSKSAPQMFVNSKKVETIASKTAGIVESRKSHILSIDFTPDPRLSSLLEEMTDLGNVNTKLSAKTESNSPGNAQKKADLYQVNGSKKYNVKVQSDVEDCDILSACILEDGTVLLSDRVNKKLKRLHSTKYTVIDYCDLPCSPWQVCSINKQQAAVCLPLQQEVHFISVTGKMKLTNKISTDFLCLGLAYADGNLYISDKHTSVYIYSVSGGKLKQFSKNQLGQELFLNIMSVAVCQDGSKIYVCDGNKGMIILDRDGKVVGGYNGSELIHAHGSCLAGDGSLLVCGWESYNILQFGMNGELIGDVVTFDCENCYPQAFDMDGELIDDVETFVYENRYPQAVCCNKQMSNMIISRHYKNEIEIFDFL